MLLYFLYQDRVRLLASALFVTSIQLYGISCLRVSYIISVRNYYFSLWYIIIKYFRRQSHF